jgi:hypothetical protein
MKCVSLIAVVFFSLISDNLARTELPTAIKCLRGGGGLCSSLQSKQIAKIITGVNLVNGFVNHQAPEAIIDAYAASDKGSVNQAWVRTVGAASLALGAAGLSLFFFDTKINTAMGWMASVWTAEHFRALLVKQETKLGANPTGRFVFSTITSLCAYACFTDADYLSKFLQIFGGISFLSFLPMAISTASAASSMFGFHILSDNAIACARASAFWNMANGVFMFAIGSGVKPETALGYALGMVLLHNITMLFITKEIEKTGAPVAPIYGFTLLLLASFGCLAFPN